MKKERKKIEKRNNKLSNIAAKGSKQNVVSSLFNTLAGGYFLLSASMSLKKSYQIIHLCFVFFPPVPGVYLRKKKVLTKRL